jgi:3-oxoacyl-[acyl-carrier-protein] synthase II
METDGYINKKMERRLDRTIKFVLLAGKKALGDAGLQWDGQDLKELDLMRCGTVVGSAFGGMSTFATAVEVLETQSEFSLIDCLFGWFSLSSLHATRSRSAPLRNNTTTKPTGFKKMNPFCIPFAITNMAGALLAMDIGFMGPNYAINTACASGNYCIHNAAGHIARGEADLMLAGSADASVLPSGIGGFIACKALSKRNDDPTGASRPWDRDRDGFVMGEGAGVLVLEEYEHAKKRGAKIYAEYAGGAFTCDAHHMTEPHPDGRGVKLCIERAVKAAGIKAEDVTYVNAHATSTPAGDMAEYRAIRAALPHSSLRMNSTKSMIGHLLGGAGAVEAIAAIKAIETGWLHPSINCESPEDGVDLDVICGRGKVQQDVKVALSNSFGFGGHNSAILFKKA